MNKKIKLFVLDNGHNENDYECIVGMPFQLTSDNRNPRAEWVSVPVYTVLIEHPDGLILYDTACHPEAMTSRWSEKQKSLTPHFATEDQLLPNALKRIGYEPKDIDMVVISHLHEDHAGCLEYFTQSKIYVHENELLNTIKLYTLNEDVGGYIHNDIEQWIKAKLNWNLVSEDSDRIELMEGVSIINLGSGHTFGMLGLLISLENSGNIILVSDAINCAVNYGPPARLPGPIYDSLGFRGCVEKVRRLEKELNAQVWFGHDSKQFARLVKADEGYYD